MKSIAHNIMVSKLVVHVLLFCLSSTVSSFSVDRRQFWGQAVAGGSAGMLVLSQPAHAASSQEAADKAKIVKGYQRLTYLLDNWEKETTVCGRSDNPYIGCERTPMKVMDYLGYRDTNDPLFKVEKTLMRLQAYVPEKLDAEYQDAMEKLVEKADEGSGLAYVSSWGESNPGGGKDRIELFIERSKKDVIEVRDSLASVIKILDLKP